MLQKIKNLINKLNFFNHIKVRSKLFFLVIIVIAFSALNVSMFMTSFDRVKVGSRLYNEISSSKDVVQKLYAVSNDLSNYKTNLVVLTVDKDADRVKGYKLQLDNIKTHVALQFDEMGKLLSWSPELSASVKEVNGYWTEFLEKVNSRFTPMINEGSHESARNLLLFGAINNKYERFLEQMDTATEVLKKRVAGLENDARDFIAMTLNRIIWINAGVMVFFILISLVIAGSVNRAITGLIENIRGVHGAVQNGQLDKKGDLSNTDFEFAPIVVAFNDTIDAFLKPIKVSADYIQNISKGVIPEPITEEYRGDFNEIKNNINGLINNLNNFTVSMNRMYEEQKAGDIEYFMDIEKFSGSYKKMAEGVNYMVKFHVDSILLFFKVTSSYSEGDFTATLPKFPGKAAIANQIMDSVKNNLQAVVDETVLLVKAAVNGELSKRGNIEKFKGGFRQIIGGINETLDAIVEPLRETAGCLEKMAEGNLAISMNGEYKGDYALMKSSMNRTVNSINEILSHVNIAADQVNTGARQVSDASQSLSQTATESASSLEEIGASMQEINSQTKQNAENAAQANGLVVKARTAAEAGNQRMRDMQSAMSEINDASRNVAKIIKAIDEIAFQTNLLALNAAVEAARAGKHGKGFTVVAEEVRNLAQRSAKAAKETAEMIESSIKKADAGSKIADETAKALGEIVAGVTKVTDLVGEIAAASKDQEKGVAQVNTGLSQVDRVTQQNTATAEEAAAASEELSSQALELQGMLQRFKLKDDAHQGGFERLALEKR